MASPRAVARAHLRLIEQPAPAAAPAGGSEHALDDTELLAAVRRADLVAAAALHDRVRPQVDRTIARLLGRADADADDVAQLALMAIVSGIDRFRGDCSLDSWASAVTARIVYKHLRRRKTERRLFDRGVDDEPPSLGCSDASTRDLLDRVLRHVSAMDENKAWTFVLHDVCGYDLREVASITGVTVSAAQTRLVRGRRDLHERIAADPELAEMLAREEKQP